MTKPVCRRCAVYTRKSSEEGLQQDFNSLQAQREACEAFIKSQMGEGWKLIPTAYDDGGISGGTMERPALQRLLADIRAGGVDIVIVYKVDRLTRSLADFAKMVEVFDAKGISFVAVTQQFNTTTSMGRLTLNVLLSFAQFEREVTGERIRDKIAASKAKGMWMGGFVPLGYDVKDRKLTVNAAEAELVRDIYKRYLALGNVRLLKQELDRLGIRSKRREALKGNASGGVSFFRGALYRVLSNPIYIGEIRHKDKRHAGQHEGIVDRTLWDAVQKRLVGYRPESPGRPRLTAPSPLVGKLFDEKGECLRPSHANKQGVRYRYYVSPRLMKGEPDQQGWRLPAPQIERTVALAIKLLLRDRASLAVALKRCGIESSGWEGAFNIAESMAHELDNQEALASCLGASVTRVDISGDGLQLQAMLKVDERLVPIERQVPLRMKRRGAEMKMIIPGSAQPPGTADPALLKALARGHRWMDELMCGKTRTAADIARREGITARYVCQLLPLAFLAPSIVTAIVDGAHPATVTLQSMVVGNYIPNDWAQQEAAIGLS
jgi:DNA invertase Pin-like site-specific DNA recombinase